MKIHHIGYLVEEIKEAMVELSKIGFVPMGEIVTDHSREIYVTFMDNEGYVVELVQAINENSPMYKLRKKHKNSPYHICYETENLNEKISNLCNGGCLPVKSPQVAPAIPGSPKVAFLVNSQIGLIELVETGGAGKC